jgi:hypothetical protein
MEEEKRSKVKIIYWVITLTPIILLNITPYIGISFPETIDNDETYNQLVLFFSLAFVVILSGAFSSFKCIVLSEIVATKIIASLFLLLYLALLLAMIYFYSRGYWS